MVLRLLRPVVNGIRHTCQALRPVWRSLVLDLVALTALCYGIFIFAEAFLGLEGFAGDAGLLFVFLGGSCCVIALCLIFTITRNLTMHFTWTPRLRKLQGRIATTGNE